MGGDCESPSIPRTGWSPSQGLTLGTLTIGPLLSLKGLLRGSIGWGVGQEGRMESGPLGRNDRGGNCLFQQVS